jgi:hypothetical protein
VALAGLCAAVCLLSVLCCFEAVLQYELQDACFSHPIGSDVLSHLSLYTDACRYCQARFARGVEYLPLDLANKAPKARVPPLAYVPPPLHSSSWGWYPEWQKIWDGWGMPAYSL